MARFPMARFDAIIGGAGFFGCFLALHLAEAGQRVLVVEAGPEAMTRASAVNQARIHTGYHYPRSFVTAARSLHNFPRFVADFREAVVDDFQMLYAIARRGSKVNARRFLGMFEAMGAPIARAEPGVRDLFDPRMIEDVFACREFAFDYVVLRRLLLDRMAGLPVTFLFDTRIERFETEASGDVSCTLSDGARQTARRAFNITYAQLNALLQASGAALLPVKHELTEIALVEPPPVLRGLGVTVLDGPFFSCMPYPARGLYSLTHVRYTPHFGWTDAAGADAYAMADTLPRRVLWRHMVNDAARYLPCLRESAWRESLFDVKTVPIKNEDNDGRPILFADHREVPNLYSVLGSKIDNIYDLIQEFGKLDLAPPVPSRSLTPVEEALP